MSLFLEGTENGVHLRRVKAKTASGLKLYTQLVESYRRSDGTPAKRVLAGLGVMDDDAYENLRAALDASRRGKRVVVIPEVAPGQQTAPRAIASLQFLDLAVLHHVWCREGLDVLLRAALGEHTSVAPTIEALVLQRCTAPDSKLAAVRWFPRTALSGLLGIVPGRFNNSRIHRDLARLEDSKPALASRIARTYAKRQGGFASLFLDVSDTWFVGRGPELAHKAKTKEGLVKRKIAVVLLCNERGYPVRWEVCEGKAADINVMQDLLRKVGKTDWLGSTPVVCDRAMGRPAAIVDMLASNIRFLTALPKTEIEPFGAIVPHEAFADSEMGLSYDDKEQAIAQAAARATAAGMRKIQDDIFLLDLGMLTRTLDKDSSRALQARDIRGEDVTVMAMKVAVEVAAEVAEGSTHAAAARARGISRSLATKYKGLLRLAPDLQEDVLQGRAAPYGLGPLLRIAALPDSQAQHQQFEKLIGTPSRRRGTPPTPLPTSDSSPAAVRVRAVAYFNPVLFVDKRGAATRIRSEIEAFVKALNDKAQARPHNFTASSMLASVRDRLKTYDLLTAFDLRAHTFERDGRSIPQVTLTLDESQWRRRRRFDGFSVLVGHPELPHGAEELCRLYRSKSCVERDFQTIKSVVELRPVHHRQDMKVRAHVTLCVLSLLLLRVLEHRLTATPLTSTKSAAAAIELLSTCRLNELGTSEGNLHTVTRPDRDQRRLLEALRCPFLADDAYLTEQLQLAS